MTSFQHPTCYQAWAQYRALHEASHTQGRETPIQDLLEACRRGKLVLLATGRCSSTLRYTLAIVPTIKNLHRGAALLNPLWCWFPPCLGQDPGHRWVPPMPPYSTIVSHADELHAHFHIDTLSRHQMLGLNNKHKHFLLCLYICSLLDHQLNSRWRLCADISIIRDAVTCMQLSHYYMHAYVCISARICGWEITRIVVIEISIVIRANIGKSAKWNTLLMDLMQMHS